MFDLVIVAVSFFPQRAFMVARLFRVLRVLRAVSVLPDLQRLVAALLRPQLSRHITLLLVLLIYVTQRSDSLRFFAQLSPQYFGSSPVALLIFFGGFTRP